MYGTVKTANKSKVPVKAIVIGIIFAIFLAAAIALFWYFCFRKKLAHDPNLIKVEVEQSPFEGMSPRKSKKKSKSPTKLRPLNDTKLSDEPTKRNSE